MVANLGLTVPCWVKGQREAAPRDRPHGLIMHKSSCSSFSNLLHSRGGRKLFEVGSDKTVRANVFNFQFYTKSMQIVLFITARSESQKTDAVHN